MLGALVIIAWTSAWSCLVFASLKWFEVLRVEDYYEHFGLDLTQHGESAYPADAWIEIQYQSNQQTDARRIGPMESQVSSEPRQRNNEVQLEQGVNNSNTAANFSTAEDARQSKNGILSFLKRKSLVKSANTV